MNAAYPDEILVVDDTPDSLRLLEEILTAAGYRVRLSSDGELALRSAKAQPPALVLLDIRMPGMDGYEVCRRLKEADKTRPIPVIFLSILEDDRDKVEGFEVGAVDYITKPFQPEEVLARIQTHLRLRDLTERLEQKVAERTAELTVVNQHLRQEVAERKRAEGALSESEERFRSFVEKANDIVYTVSPEGSFIYVSPNWKEILGHDVSEVEGKSFEIFVHPDDLAACRAILNRTIVSGEKQSGFEYRVKHKNGSWQWHTSNASVIRDADGKIIFLLAIAHNITERKQAEEEIRRLNEELEQRVTDRTAQLEAAIKELEEFTYSVAHDLRAPLRHIDGFLELLQARTTTILDEKSRHYMTSIAESAHKMGSLIDNLLSFSRMGHNEMFKSLVNIDELMQDVIRELKPETEGRDIQWKISPLPMVTGDRAMLHIALVNLISNSLKFTRPRKIAQIEIGCEVKDEKEMVIFVRDNGVGFDMEYVDKLFRVFQRLHRQEDFEGTGIGLANVRRIINRHGGRTWAEGAIDHGATFYFSLPQPMHEAHP